MWCCQERSTRVPGLGEEMRHELPPRGFLGSKFNAIIYLNLLQ
jgi:hypothetical protein